MHAGHDQARPSEPGGHGPRGSEDQHAGMVPDFQRRFWICLALTVPILLLSSMTQMFRGLGPVRRFPSSDYILLTLSSIVYLYGGYPFLNGLVTELRERRPGMMTLIAVAITIAYIYSAGIVRGLKGEHLFGELATLIDIMLLGHWLEMRSVMGASRALEELAKLMPASAHWLQADGSVRDVPLAELQTGDRVRVKPGEKIPADSRVAEGQSMVSEALRPAKPNP